jgi:hypothetical protein
MAGVAEEEGHHPDLHLEVGHQGACIPHTDAAAVWGVRVLLVRVCTDHHCLDDMSHNTHAGLEQRDD